MIAWQWIADLLWPARCAGCGTYGQWWCRDCHTSVVAIKASACPFCNKLTEGGRCCPRCRSKTALTGLVAGAYLRGPLWNAIKALKYRQAKAIAPSLAAYQTSALVAFAKPATLLPVPLHAKRLARRGHNQALLLAEAVAKATGLPIRTELRRVKDTLSQTGLPRSQRRDNVADSFRWSGKPLSGIVILVDDIFTTGATLDACARACRKAGARQVWGLVVAKR